MTRRTGRNPLMTGHVEHLYGSPHAKDRMAVFLETLRGSMPVADACSLLDVKEAQFFNLRRQWMQGSIELCEPRPLGRPPKQQDPAQMAARIAELESEVANLREQVQGAAVREEIARILSAPAAEPLKKMDNGATPGKPR